MRGISRSSIALLLAGLAGGCTSDDYQRTEGPTLAAGNAQASNTVMQMVDPWKYGVQNTKLLVPAKRDTPTVGSSNPTAAAPTSQSTTSN